MVDWNFQWDILSQSGYQISRDKKEKVSWHKVVWGNHLPHKISFLLWRVLKKKISTDDVIKRMGIPVVSKYYCYDTGAEETLNHLFLTAPIALQLWKYFVTCSGFTITGQSLTNTLKQ